MAKHSPYDPVKAHEYYMKHRKLKGRKKGSTPYTRKTRRAANQAKVNRLRKRLAETQKRVQTKLKKFLKVVDGTEIPVDASPKLQAFLARQKSLRGSMAKENADREIRRVQLELKKAVAKARKSYADRKK